MSNKDIINNYIKDEVIKIVLKANEAIMDIFLNNQFKTKFKKDNSPVTEADLSAHNIIVKGLKILTPEIPVISEENEESFSMRSNNELFWLIDPLDGTKEFINRSEDFTCNIGLIKDNLVIFGFVGVPAKNLVYYGGKSFESNLRYSNGEIKKIKCKRSTNTLRIIASKSHLNEETNKFINSLKKPYELITAGSSLKFLKIAEGLADIYPRMAPTSEWDTAAAHAVLEGAGGSVLQINGNNLIYGKENIINPKFIATNRNLSDIIN